MSAQMATARVHGYKFGENGTVDTGTPPGMVTMVLPVPEALAPPDTAASKGCPHLQLAREAQSGQAGSVEPLPQFTSFHARLAAHGTAPLVTRRGRLARPPRTSRAAASRLLAAR